MRSGLEACRCLSFTITSLLLTCVLIIHSTKLQSMEAMDELQRFRVQDRKQVKELQRRICVKGEANATTSLIDQLQCVEQHASKGSGRALRSIWNDVVGTDYPESQTDWKNFICGTRYFQLKKDLVDVALMMREVADDESLEAVHRHIQAYDKCEHLNRTVEMMFAIHSKRSWDRNQQTIASLVNNFATLVHRTTGIKLLRNSTGITGSEDVFSEPVDKCDMVAFNANDSYCLQRRDYSLNRTQVCTHRNASFIDELVHQHRCLERRASHRMSRGLRSCWKLVTGAEYPTHDQDFANFTCVHRYPLALRRIVDKCRSHRT